MMRLLVQRSALMLGAVLGLLGTRPATANAQKALVYCPVAVDATGCNAIVNALTGPAYPLGVDRGYDGTGGTVDLKAVDLFTYSVFVVPSLADDATSQPYALLRDPEVAEHLKAALIGRLAMWSGSPDQGATNRAMKDALIQNLAGWAGASFGTAKGPGLVALLDASASATTRYDWVRAITPVPLTSDPALLIYSAVRALDARATSILTSGAGPIAYDNMATFGFQVPNGAAGVSLDAVGQTGTTQGGQVVLLTMEAGNSSGAIVRTDRDDYGPGETVTITGTGWQAGETIKLSLHMDPLRDADTELSATADGNGAFTNTDFAPATYDIGVRFVLSAMGQTSGRRAQTTFTDGNKVTFSTTAAGTEVTNFGTVNVNQCVDAFVQERQGANIDNGNHAARAVALASTSGTTSFFAGAGCSGGVVTSVTIPLNTSNAGFSFQTTATGTFTISGNGASLTGSNNASASITVAGAAPTATNDSYSTDEDQQLTVAAPGVLGNDVGTGPLTAVVVASPPVSAGTLSLAANGGFTFNPAPDFNGSTSFTYRAQNSGGLSAPATVTITINAINDAPTFTLIASHTSLEDAGAQTAASAVTATSPGPTDETGQAFLSLTATNDNNALFSVQPSIDLTTGVLTYTAAANASGIAIVSVTLQDNGGTTGGGVDATTKTFTITITPVNDAPSFTKGADQTVLEDAAAQSVSAWATAISAGPADESAQTLTFAVTNNTNPALFSAAPAVAANGTLTYTPAANASGTATITLKITDNGGTTNGGVNESATQTFVINVTEVNDAPTFTKGADQTLLEDAGAQTATAWATNISKGPGDENGQVLTFQVTGNTNAGLFSVAPSVDPATGTLTFTPAPNAFGSATVTLQLSDDGGTTNGGVDASSQSFVINVTPVNDAPSFTKGADETVNEDAGAQSVVGWATAISAGPLETGQIVDFIVTSNNPALFSAQPEIDASGKLTYTPGANANGAATVTVQIHDDGGTANGGVNTSAAQTFTITVNAVNDAPSFTKGADQTVLEDATAQTVTNWATGIIAGPADEELQVLTFSATNSNNALFSVQPAVAANGTLTYTPVPNAFGSATVTLTLKDDGGTANGGVDTSAPQTFTITVKPVNDAPTFTKGSDQTVLEDAGAQSVGAWATSISAGHANESGQTLTFVVINNSNPTLFAGALAVASNGTLTYTPALNANGSATITLKLVDDGGTLDGGVDQSAEETFVINVTAVNDAPTYAKGGDETVNEDAGAQTVNGWATSISKGPSDESGQALTFSVTNNTNAGLFSAGPAVDPTTGTLTYTPAADAFGSATITLRLSDNGGTANGGVDFSEQTFTISVNAVNDAPSFTKGNDQTVDEDAGAQSVSPWATGISTGPANESSQTVSFVVTGNTNPGLFSAAPAIASNGTLTYTPAANEYGTATITLVAKDNGGTMNGGVDTSAPQTFVITVNPVNDAPTFDLIASDLVLEDAGARSVPNALTNKSAGPANESGQVLSLTVTNDNNGLFSAQPAINLATGELTYTPAPNANGTATATVKLMDDGGTANGGVDATTKTLTITVTAVNDAPSFTKGANQTSLEDAGIQTVPGWATAISAGPLDEAGQALNFVVTNDNNGLFATQPAVAANGELTYTAVPNANGSATVTIKLHDNGGIANGGIDTSADQTFTITITPVNDAPSFTKGADETVLEDSGPKTVASWATAISAGPADESGQSLEFVVSNNNTALFSVQPTIAPNGTLTYTPAANAYGFAVVTVHIHDNGGTANGGVDASADQTFKITITPVNDVPSFAKGANQTVNEDAGAQTVAGWATAISAGPNETQAVDFVVTNDNNALFSVQPAIDASGNLTYTSAADANGLATVTVKIHDDGGTANGGVDTSAEQTITITVNAVNDAPSFTKGADQTVLEDAGPQTVTPWATAISAGPADESGQTLNFIVTNDNNSLFSAQPAISATGELTFTAVPNANGIATVTVKLHDNGGIANGGVDTSAEQTFTITVTAVNDVPSFVKGANRTSLEDAGGQTVGAWASSISAGPANESGQTLNFIVTNDNNALFLAQPAVDANGQLTYTAAPNANGSTTVTIKLHDSGGTANGGVDTSPDQTFTITITPVNDAPTYDLITSTQSNEDAGPQTVTGAVTSQSVGPANESGQSIQTIALTNTNNALFSAQPGIDLSGNLTYTAAPNANGSATVTVTVTDNGGTANGGVNFTTKTFTITISTVNDAPVITTFSAPVAPNAVNTSVTATGAFTDVDLGDVPLTESHVVTIEWGDATTSTVTPTGTGTSRSVSGTHTYTNPGVYTIKLTVKDGGNLTDSRIYQYVVVYDPNGGFVTGGGWIDSPAGACRTAPCTPQTMGKANFGFVSKYKKGQSTPDGNTEFQFKAGDINFHSENYEWLVVAGAKAQFKGAGTINGSGNYGFLLTAVDGQLSGGGGADKFRIKIWDKNNGDVVVYDNQMNAMDDAMPTTLVGGGSINIQTK